MCPITSHLIDTPLFRLTLKPTKYNGLKDKSQIMVDKLTAIKSEKITKIIGKISEKDNLQLNEALMQWLDLT